MSNSRDKACLVCKEEKIIISMVICVLVGRGYQFLFWDSPFRTFLWDEGIMKPVIEFFGGNWKDYITNTNTDFIIDIFSISLGILFFTTALLFFFIKSKTTILLKICAFVLVIIALLSTKEHFYFPVQFFEYTVQFGVLFLFPLLVKEKQANKKTLLFATSCLSLTFIAHGFYALNIYPRPYNFYEMTMNILSLSQAESTVFLNLAGFLDFIVAFFAFFIFSKKILLIKIGKIALRYMLIWGLLTASARIIAYWQWADILNSLHQFGFQTLYRLPHGLLALWILGVFNVLSIKKTS